MKQSFNIYCDESSHLENDQQRYMVLGSIKCPYNQVKMHTNYIKELKNKHNFYAELKWTNVSASKVRFYDELLEYFFATDISFRAIVIDKTKIDLARHGKSYDDFYYTMYYYLLNHNLDTSSKYYVYLDIKDSLSAHKVHKLQDILNIKLGVFKTIQNIRSHESQLLQLCDLLTGAISYYNNHPQQNAAKVQILKKITQNTDCSLNTTNHHNKFNLFFIELR